MQDEQIAQVVHEANRAYCQAIGDYSQKPWFEAPRWQVESSLVQVRFARENPDALPSHSHESWLAQKVTDGWVYGAVKDEIKKEHPCCVPYSELPVEHQKKDALFAAVVRALV